MRNFAVLGLALLFTFSCRSGSRTGTADNAYADMYNTIGTASHLPIRGRLVVEKEAVDIIAATPIGEFSQDEIREAIVSVTLVSGEDRYDAGEIKGDSEGYYDAIVSPGAPAGTYTVEYSHSGAVVGTATARILADDHSDIVVRSDVDLTYLLTDFHSSTALAELVAQDAGERETLPAMETVYEGLRGDNARPLTFLSGSPRFFKRTLEGKMQLDGVQQDGLVLKPFKDIVLGQPDLTKIVPDLKEQVGYKLYFLLRLRLALPQGTPEVLMGDDSEADHVVYNLYQRFTSGELDVDGLLAELDDIAVAESWREIIAEVAPDVEADSPVLAIYINATEVPSETFPIEDWIVPGLTRHHQGAWPLALDLAEEGWITTQQADAVAAKLRDLGQTDDQLDAARDAADFLDD